MEVYDEKLDDIVQFKKEVDECIKLVNSKPNWEEEVKNKMLNFKVYFGGDVTGYEFIIEYLYDHGLFESAASTKFHGAFAGGLLKHCLSVLGEFLNFYIGWSDISDHFSLMEITLMCLLHDTCKIGYYKEIKDDRGSKWIRNPVKTRAMGHGVESVFWVERMFRELRFPQSNFISIDSLEAIRWHMGWYDLSKYDEEHYYNAKKTNPLVLTLHYADDMSASWRED